MTSLIIFTSTSKIIWLNYSSTTGCITCHRIASVKMSDTLFVIGSFATNDLPTLRSIDSILNIGHDLNNLNNTSHLTPFLVAVDSALNIKWYKAFEHNLDNLIIDKMVKVNDSLIAISGGHSGGFSGDYCPNGNCTFFGIFNIKTKNFVWAKYRSDGYGNLSATAIDFDGSNLIIGAQSTIDNGGSWVLKTDLYGNILWQKLIYGVPGGKYVMDVVYDGSGYVFLIMDTVYAEPFLVKLDLNGNHLWTRAYTNFYSQASYYKLLKDIDGYIVVGFTCRTTGNNWCTTTFEYGRGIVVFKTSLNENTIIWSRVYSYSSNPEVPVMAYNADFDYDGNILVSGFIRAGNRSIILKINRNNGNLIWARMWNNPPNNYNNNRGAGVISIKPGKFYLMTFIGNYTASGVDASGGIAIIREDTSLPDNIACTKPITLSQDPFGPTPKIPSPFIVADANYTLYNLTFTPYNPSINQFQMCFATPINNYEGYMDCSIKVLAKKGYIEFNLSYENEIRIYNILGREVYRDRFKGLKKVYLKQGIYIVSLNNKKIKVVLR